MDGKDIVRSLQASIDDAKRDVMETMTIKTFERYLEHAEKYATECYDYKKM